MSTHGKSLLIVFLLLAPRTLFGQETRKPVQPAELIKVLHSPNIAPQIILPDRVMYGDGYNWPAQQKVVNAWKELHIRFEESLPSLVEEVSNESYCITAQIGASGAYVNLTVGNVCSYVVALNIEMYGRPYQRSRSQSFLIACDRSPGANYSSGITEWWRTRQGKSVRSLQIEALRGRLLMVNVSASLGDMDASVAAEEATDIESVFMSLEAGKPVKAPSWVHSDELYIDKRSR